MAVDPEESFAVDVCLPFLRSAQNSDGGWGFRPGAESRAEPTCWTLRALMESSEGGDAVTRGLQFLRAAQLPDGSWPATPEEKSGCWVTSLCCSILLTATTRAANESTGGVAAGIRWLCEDWPSDSTPWRRFLARFSSSSGASSIDTSYRGWSWTPKTSSWVEPTSYALLALEQAPTEWLPRKAARRRTLATSLLYDRMCPGGGWNCGNPRVYGVDGEPLVGPTVWALLALRQWPTRSENAMSLDWLMGSVREIQSAGSLALAKICLKTYGRDWPTGAPTLHDLHERNGSLESVQVAAWSYLGVCERLNWLSTPGAVAA